jgi:hypothetical protein
LFLTEKLVFEWPYSLKIKILASFANFIFVIFSFALHAFASVLPIYFFALL